MLARLRIHHRQMKPGRVSNLRQAARSPADISPGETARGPISDMSPRSTFSSAGRPAKGPRENEISRKLQPQRPMRGVRTTPPPRTFAAKYKTNRTGDSAKRRIAAGNRSNARRVPESN